MIGPARIWRRLRSLVTSARLDEELDEEIRFHIEMEAEKRIAAGEDPVLARERARRDFGGVSNHHEETRDARGTRAVEELLRDLRIGARILRTRRTFATVAILTLAIGIGGTTALWTAVYHVLLKPYPYAEADRIVAVWQTDARTNALGGEFSPGNFIDLEERARSFDMIAAAEPWSVDWIGPEGPERFNAALVTADGIAIQGLRPLLGRNLLPSDFEGGGTNAVMLSEPLWRTRFGGDTALVGSTLVLDSVPRTVVGVAARDAMRPYDADVFVPRIPRGDERAERRTGYWTVIGRLAPGVTLQRANDELRGIARQLAAELPASNRYTEFRAVALREAMTGSSRRSLLVLFGAVVLVLLIACVNVATLQIGEAVRRRRELAIRTAIGAGRGRLVRQVLTESLLLAALGTAVGLLLAWAGIRAIRLNAPTDLWMLRELGFEGMTVAFAFALALACGAATAVLPVLAARRIHLADSLVAGGRSGMSFARRRAGRVLVVAEVALALVLLVSAGLLIRSLGSLLRVERGFRTEQVLATNVQAWSYYPTPDRRVQFVRQALAALEEVPGVDAAGMTSALPLSWPIGLERARVSVVGRPVAPGDEAPAVRATAITAGYLSVLAIPLIAGRGFVATDAAGAPAVALISREFQRRYFPDENPIGQQIVLPFQGPPTPREIVGVVGDVRHEGPQAAFEPAVYVPHAQAPTGAIHFVLRTGMDPALLERSVRATLREINGSMPIVRSTTMEALLGESLRERRFQLGLLTAFSLTALLLSAIGIYGVVSRATAERTHEIGVRMAVGAVGSEVRWMVLRSAGALTVLGVLIGAAAAGALTRYMSSMLFGITAHDPLSYGVAAVVLLIAGVLAAWIPARRASAVDPVVALRSD